MVSSPLPLFSSTASWPLGAILGAASSSKAVGGRENLINSRTYVTEDDDARADTENVPPLVVERYKKRLSAASHALDRDKQARLLGFLPHLKLKSRSLGNANVPVVQLNGIQYPAGEFLTDTKAGILPGLIVEPPTRQVISTSGDFITFPRDDKGHTLVETSTLNVPTSLQFPALKFVRKAMELHQFHPMRDIWLTGIFGNLNASYQQRFYGHTKFLLDVTGLGTSGPKVHGMAAFSIKPDRLDLQDVETLGNWPGRIRLERGSGQRLLNYLLARALSKRKNFSTHSALGAIGFFKKRGLHPDQQKNIFLRPDELLQLFNGYRLRVATLPSTHSVNLGASSDVAGIVLERGEVGPASHILTLNQVGRAGDSIIIRLVEPRHNTYRDVSWNEFSKLHDTRKFSVLTPHR